MRPSHRSMTTVTRSYFSTVVVSRVVAFLTADCKQEDVCQYTRFDDAIVGVCLRIVYIALRNTDKLHVMED